MLAACLAASAALLWASTASAYDFTISSPVLASGPNPFATCTAGGFGSDVVYPNTEVEPFVAVNPTDPTNLIGVYQQDRWSTLGARGLVTSRSVDGGSSWAQNVVPFSACAGADGYDRASDPWVTFDAAGNAYQISLGLLGQPPATAIQVSKSTDKGVTWGAPVTLIADDGSNFHFSDKESITGDPTRPGHVYAVWHRTGFPTDERSAISQLAGLFSLRGYPMFSRTTDGGETWSVPREITNQDIGAVGNQIAVLPDGTLVDVYSVVFKGSGTQPSPDQHFQAVQISRDAGFSWSQPIKIANQASLPVQDPDTGQQVRGGVFLPEIAVDPNTGVLYVVWAESRFSGGIRNDIALSRSTDGGRSWSIPVRANQTPTAVDAFTPSVEVASDGTVAVSYYDFRGNTPAPGLPTDVWLAHSHDGGATWSEQHVAGPFDMESAPITGCQCAPSFFVGDYTGLEVVGRDFLALVAYANDGNAANPTDVSAVRASAP